VFDFPNAPANGQTFSPVAGLTYAFDGTVWKRTSGGLASVFIGDTPPGNPTHGMLWWEADSGNTYIYYDDGDSKQWVQFNLNDRQVPPYMSDPVQDMWAGFRTGASFVINDQANGAGNDLFWVYDGTGATTIGARSAGAVEANNTGFQFNLWNDGTNWRRRAANAAGLINVDASAQMNFYTSATGAVGSVAALTLNASFIAGNNKFYGTNSFYGSIVVNQGYYLVVDARSTTQHAATLTAGTNAMGLLAYANGQTIYGGCGAYASGSGTWCFYGASSSGYLVGGTWQSSSDERLKENFEPIDPVKSLEAVLAVPAYSFTWINERLTQPDKEPRRIGGWKAQEVQPEVPVAIAEYGLAKEDIAIRAIMRGMKEIPGEGEARETLAAEDISVLGMDLQTMVAVLWSAVQALSAQVDELKAAR
jgi:Chaperone of endosialidase